MNSLQTVKRRVYGYDLLKALAMFMVVFYHFLMLDFSFEPGQFYMPDFNKIIHLICAAGVPLFFMVNGALTINNNISIKKVIIIAPISEEKPFLKLSFFQFIRKFSYFCSYRSPFDRPAVSSFTVYY